MRTRYRLSRKWSQSVSLTVQVICLVAVIQFWPHQVWMVAVLGTILGLNLVIGITYSRPGRRARPHLFDPDQWSRTSAAVGMDQVLSPLEGGDGTITARSMATCADCGMGLNWRAHQPRAWRFRHPFRTWNGPDPYVLTRGRSG